MQDKSIQKLRADVGRMTSVTDAAEVPKSSSQTFGAAFRDLAEGFRQHELWLQLGWQDIKQRYRRSTLGPLWITIATGVMAVALGLLYALLFQIDWRVFLPHVTVGFIVWGFIAGCIKDGSNVFIDNEGLIKQLPSALSVHVYRVVWRQVLFFAHNLIIWVIMIPILNIPLNWEALMAIPAFALLVVNGVWVTMFFGVIATRFRDVAPLLDALTQLAFYITPIVWTTHTLEQRGGEIAEQARIVEINPLFHYLEIVRAPMLGQHVEAYHWWIVLGFTVVGLALTLLMMRQWRFRVSYWV